MVNRMDQNTKSNRLKILLVENSRTARAALTEQLAQWGYTCTAVSNGLEAIDTIKENNYQIVILDVFMPHMNGHEVAKSIRALSAIQQPHLVALTASEDPSDRDSCIAAGMDTFILKTPDNADLKATLDRLAE